MRTTPYVRDDSEQISVDKARHSTDRLLERLIEYHGELSEEAQPEPEVVPVDEDEEVSEPIEVCVLPVLDTVPTIEGIKRVVCRHYGLTHTEMISQRRALRVVRPRQMAMLLCKDLTARSFFEIGRRFGDKDHTTVMHACQRTERFLATDAKLADDYASLKSMLTA